MKQQTRFMIHGSMLTMLLALAGCGSESEETIEEEPIGQLESPLIGTFTYDGPITTSLFRDTGVGDVFVGINEYPCVPALGFYLSNIGDGRVDYCIRVRCPNFEFRETSFTDFTRRGVPFILGHCVAGDNVKVDLRLNDAGPPTNCP